MSNKETTPVERQSGSADPQIRRLAEELYRERVAEARQMLPEEKLLAGEELFDTRARLRWPASGTSSPG